MARAVKDESLPLRVLAGIGPEYANWEVVSVTGNTRPNSPARTTATLIANGRALATQVNPGSRISLLPSRRLTLGELNLGDLQLSIGGSTYIDNLEIELRYDQSKVVVIDINDTASNNDVIDLGDFDEVVRNTGRSVDQVLITATSPDNSGSILVVMNGAAVGQTSFTNQVQEQALYVDQEQLLNSGDWATSLYTSGNLSIQKVTLILK